MAIADTIAELVEPVIADHDADLYDVTLTKGRLLVAVTRPGGIDLDTLADITRQVSRLLDEHDPVNSSYTLEVSSPGLERTLRTPAHFAGAVGEQVTVKTRPNVPGDRRTAGVLADASDDTFTVRTDDAERTLRYDEVDRVRTVFEWGPTPKPSDRSDSEVGSR